MKLKLKARHFRGTSYRDSCDCAISKAVKEHIEKVRPGALRFINTTTSEVALCLHGQKARHYPIENGYWSCDFSKDQRKSRFLPGWVTLRKVEIQGFFLSPIPPEKSDVTSEDLTGRVKGGKPAGALSAPINS